MLRRSDFLDLHGESLMSLLDKWGKDKRGCLSAPMMKGSSRVFGLVELSWGSI